DLAARARRPDPRAAARARPVARACGGVVKSQRWSHDHHHVHEHEHVHGHDEACGPGCPDAGRGGIGGFLRSLLAGIPWSERVEVIDTITLAPPRSGVLRLDNANGMTRILGED